MKETLKTKLLRIIRERRIKIIKWIIRKAVRKLDVLQYEGFLAYSWKYNEEIDYNILKERSTETFHQYGTSVTYYDKDKQGAVKPRKQEETSIWTVCGNCSQHLLSKWLWCPYCGKQVNWND